MTAADPTEPGHERDESAPFPADDHRKPLDTAELDLGDEEVRLPWLEADEDDDDAGGGTAGQFMGLLLLGLVAVGLIGGGIWWVMHKRNEPALVADGGVIAAPKQPYKEQPADPGGKTFEGTGDTSFAISKGQTRPARLGEENPTAEPAPAKPVKPPVVASAAVPEPAGGVGVQIGAYSRQAAAEEGWTRLSQQHEILSGLRHRVVEGRADIGTVYRLQAVAADAAAARALCGRLKAAGLACQVKN